MARVPPRRPAGVRHASEACQRRTICSRKGSCRMTKEPKSPAGRREFLKDAAAGAAALIADSRMAAGHDHDHQHEHQAIPSDVALRVKALESVLVEKGMVDHVRARCCRRDVRAEGGTAQRREGRCAGVGRSGVQEAPAHRLDRCDRRARLQRRAGRVHGRRREPHPRCTT